MTRIPLYAAVLAASLVALPANARHATVAGTGSASTIYEASEIAAWSAYLTCTSSGGQPGAVSMNTVPNFNGFVWTVRIEMECIRMWS